MKKYVTGFNGARDSYQFPLALYEGGILCRHVSDFYLSNDVASFLKNSNFRINSRCEQKLPSEYVDIPYAATLYNAKRLLFNYNQNKNKAVFNIVDRIISLRAAKLAKKYSAGLALHSGYAYWAFNEFPNAEKVIFQYHPHPVDNYNILTSDLDMYPEMIYSFNSETDSSLENLNSKILLDECKLANLIICASSFTKRSLVNYGCSADSIKVVPYGINKSNIENIIPHEKNKKCEFLYVGQGVQRKGLHHLLRVWRDGLFKNCGLTLVLNKVDPGLIGLIKDSGANVLSGLSFSELNDVYMKADIFVMPSLVEGFGLVYLEALQRGLFCIGTNNTGLPDLNLSDRAVSIIEAGDLRALSSSINDAYFKWRDSYIDKKNIIKEVEFASWGSHRVGVVNAIKWFF